MSVQLDQGMLDQFESRPVLRGEVGSWAVLVRARRLGDRERTLVEMALIDRASHRRIGSVLGMTAGAVSRRLRDVLARLNRPLVVWLLERSCPLPEELREVGIGYWVRRETEAELAERLGVSRRQVRGMLERMEGWFMGEREGSGVRVRGSGKRESSGEGSGVRGRG